jgi:hypothetical protein
MHQSLRALISVSSRDSRIPKLWTGTHTLICPAHSTTATGNTQTPTPRWLHIKTTTTGAIGNVPI